MMNKGNLILCLCYIIPLAIDLFLLFLIEKEVRGKQHFNIIKCVVFVPIINITLVVPILLTYAKFRTKFEFMFHEEDFYCKVYSNPYTIILKYYSDKYNTTMEYELSGYILQEFGIRMNLKEKETYVIKKFKRMMKKKGIEVC